MRAFTAKQTSRTGLVATEKLQRREVRSNFYKKVEASDTSLASTWSQWPDLNRRPADYESAALPAVLHWHKKRVTRFYFIFVPPLLLSKRYSAGNG